MNPFLNFIIPGCAKGGTTSVYHYLRNHPEVFMADIKETNFLLQDQSLLGQGKGYEDPGLISSPEAYRALFARVAENQICGEVCNAYLYFYQEAIPCIQKNLGDPRIIIILREPVSRTFSGYLHLVRENLVQENFADCLGREHARIQSGYWWGFHIQSISHYAEAVNAYRKAFSNVDVLFYEDLAEDPIRFFNEVCRLLEIHFADTEYLSARSNITGVPRNGFLAGLLRNKSAMKSAWQKMIPESYRNRLSRRLWQWLLKKPQIDETLAGQLKQQFEKDVQKLDSIIPGTAKRWGYHAV